MHGKLFISPILAIALITLPTYTQSLTVYERLSEVVNHAASIRTYTRTTICFTTFKSSSTLTNDHKIITNFVESFNFIPVVHVDSTHSVDLLTSHTRKNHTVSRHDLFTFITVLVLNKFEDTLDFRSTVRHSIDPRRDYLIFVDDSEDPATLAELRTFKGLKFRNKVVINAKQLNEIWVEPLHYTGNTVAITSIKEKPNAPPMGQNLRGRTIIASAPETPPFNFKAGEDTSGNAIVEGSLCKIFMEASKKFNFTPEVHYAGFDYGTLHPNGTWTGSYSKIHYPDSGFDMDLITSSELLWNQMDLSALATSIDMMFGVAHPVVKKHWYAFLLPFEPAVWKWTCLTFMFIGAVQGVVMYLIHSRQLKPIVIESTWLLPFAITMEQGLQDIPVGMRYTSLILLMGCTVLGTGYKSTLRTHLMFPKPDTIPTTFDELADRTDFAVALTVNGALEKHFWATSEVRAVRKIRERLTFENNWGVCYKKAFLREKQACVSWVHGKAVVAKEMTLNTTVEPLVYGKDAAIRKFLGLGFQENSIYVDSFMQITGTPGSMGIVSKWEEDIWTKFKKQGREHMLKQEGSEIFNKLVELAKPEEDAVPLELGSLVVVLGFIPFGGLLGGLAFVGELWVWKRNETNRGGKSGNQEAESPTQEDSMNITTFKHVRQETQEELNNDVVLVEIET